MWWVEVAIGGVLPWCILASSRARRSPALLTGACTLRAFGLLMNRINVFLTAYHSSYVETRYFPSVFEILLTGGLLALFLVLFRALLTIFPIWPRATESEPAPLVREKGEVHA